MKRKFDWVGRPDARNLRYSIRTVVGATVPDMPKLWEPGKILDQGAEGACVGFGWTGELIGSPLPDPYVNLATATDHARGVYLAAQKIDQWEGEDYEGTSVLAGAKVVQAEGFIGEYRWAWTVEDIRDAIITTGPVVIGVNWYESMYDTDENGIVHIGGQYVGGHCLFVYEYHPGKRLPGDYWGRHRVFRWRNSWGPSYGINGSGYVKWDDMKRLLSEGGEACVPMARKRVRL